MLKEDSCVGLVLEQIKNLLGHTDADLSEPYWIMCHVLKTSRSKLDKTRKLSTSELDEIQNIIQKRQQAIPLDYIFGSSNFYGLNIIIDSNTLIPRMETELLAEMVIKEINSSDNKRYLQILDLCTGSGCIAAAIGANSSVEIELTLSDIDTKALEIAKRNMNELVGNLCKWQVLQSDLFDKIQDKFDIIVCNPPYIDSDTIASLSAEVRSQPQIALDGGIDGLDFYRHIAKNSKRFLRPGGKLFFEIGYDQGELVRQVLQKNEFKNILVKKDYSDLDRVVVAEAS